METRLRDLFSKDTDVKLILISVRIFFPIHFNKCTWDENLTSEPNKITNFEFWDVLHCWLHHVTTLDH